MDKRLIAERFARARDTYSHEARVQQQVAEKMLQLLTERASPLFRRIVEFGCGTGSYSRLLLHKLQPESLLLNDLCPEMKECLTDLLPQDTVRFIPGDAEALDFPEKVKTLVLIGTPHKIPKAAFGIQNLIFRFLPRSVFDTMAFDKESTFVLGNSMKKLDFSGRVRGMRCPVLIICGEKDRSNIRSAQYLSQNIPGAELQLIEHTGHVVNEENPKALAERLNTFYSLHP